MKKWLVSTLLIVLLVLAYLVVRERYTNYEEALKDVGQTAGYITPTCEEGYTINVDQSECSKSKPDGTKDIKDPKCPDGSSLVKHGGSRGVCEPPGGPTAAETTTSTPGPVGTSDQTTVPTGSTGTSDQTTVPTGQTGSTQPSFGDGKGVWGPLFTGLGEGGNAVAGDSTKTANYPVLIGGFPERSNVDKLDMPSDASLGIGENAQYFPFSRQPGDMDLIPNPYKGGFQGVSTREPVPFLTDFSAFMK